MSEPTYHVRTIAFGYNERSDWVVQSYLNSEAENNFLLDRVILTDRGQLDQTYKYWVIITKLAYSNTPHDSLGYPSYAFGNTPGSD